MTASGDVDVRLDGAAIAQLLTGEQGPVMVDMARRSEFVKTEARARVGYSAETDEFGHIRDHLVKRFVRDSRGAAIIIGGEHPRILMHHEGTQPHIIVPRNARVLVFESGGELRFAAQVNHPGTQPNRFLVDALSAARG